MQMDFQKKKRIYPGFAKPSHAEETFVIINWHYARNNRTSYSNLPTIIHKLEKNISIIEKLSDNKICTSINLQGENTCK